MVSKTDDMSHDTFSATKHPKTPELPRLDDIGDTAFTLSQRVADADGKLVRPEGHPVVAENPADVPFPKDDEETVTEPVEETPAPVESTPEPSVEEQLNFNLEEENK